MAVVLFLLVVSVLFLAYSNGANDNFKGVATLYGSRTCGYRTALAWATVTTLAGSLLALVLAHGLVQTFRGKGLVPDAVTAQPAFLLAVSLGAALTVMVATRTGMPVSTTHALTGGLVGAGLVAAPGEVRFEALGGAFVLPLLLSPVVAILLTVLIYPLFRWTRRRSGVTTDVCVCVGTINESVVPLPDGTLTLARTGVVIEVATTAECVERYRGRFLGVEVGWAVDGLHFMSGGAVGFARGLNDTPKIVALLLAGETVDPTLGLAAVAVVMAVGGVLNAHRVADTMSRKITRMNPGQGFTANLVTAVLVASASRLGLPVSTTHVSVGSLFGIGVVSRTARARTILAILLAWATTLPTGAFLAAVAYFTLRTV
ncbi:MAG: inorganic phosphate transporter family protein [Planctomycetes bacterium]|nr:inorganic phosphate transporter family protein [Planctomycetota bacterium]